MKRSMVRRALAGAAAALALMASATQAQAQNAVETKARAVDARRAPVNAKLEWTVSDPELLAVSPSVGERVTITAKRPGVSTVTVKAGEARKSLTFRADKPNGAWKVSLSQ